MAWSKALNSVHEYRDQLFSDAKKISSDDGLAVCYSYHRKINGHNYPCISAFEGRRKKPTFSYRFLSTEERDKKAKDFMQKHKEKAGFEALKRAEARKPHSVKVGDVFVSSWGHEQTNVDFYIVQEVIGKSTLLIAEIGQHKEYNGDMHGTCKPNVTKVIGEPMRKRLDMRTKTHISISSFQRASLAEYKLVDGERVYRSYGWSSWA